MKLRGYIGWFLPFWIYIAYYCFRLTMAERGLYSYYGLIAVGIALGLAGVVLIFALFIEHPIVQIILSIGTLVFSFVSYFMVIVSSFQTHLLIAGITVYLDVIAIYLLIHRPKKEGYQKNKTYFKNNFSFKKKSRAILAGVTLVTIISSPLLILQLNSGAFLQPQHFEITDSVAEGYNLVVYFPAIDQVDNETADIFNEVNATLSFAMNENNFRLNDTWGITCAKKVALLNAKGVKVEIWPIFNGSRDRGHYPTYSNVKYWPDVYQSFHTWVTWNNLTVDYLMWDIEVNADAPVWSDENPLENATWPFNYWGMYPSDARAQAQVAVEWETIISTIQDIGAQADSDGYHMICTTFTIVRDLFDGDSDKQIRYGLPAWDAGDETFELISMMSYRGCEWGGEPGLSSSIFENVRAEALTWTGGMAICLGCINYTPYPNITSVVDDVRLALSAAVLDAGRSASDVSVRLFQANSWINGVGTWQNSNTGQWVYGGPAHGLDNETMEGLRQLLLECRKGGGVDFIPNRGERTSYFNEILLDVIWDMGKPYVKNK